jgi:hypothetical protein
MCSISFQQLSPEFDSGRGQASGEARWRHYIANVPGASHSTNRDRNLDLHRERRRDALYSEQGRTHS